MNDRQLNHPPDALFSRKHGLTKTPALNRGPYQHARQFKCRISQNEMAFAGCMCVVRGGITTGVGVEARSVFQWQVKQPNIDIGIVGVRHCPL
jgi:hypothetical protein